MNKKLIFIQLSFFICIANTLNAEYTISGIVQNQNGDIIKKGSIVLLNEVDGEFYLEPWLTFTTQNEFMIHSDSILTLVDPKADLLSKYFDFIK